MEKFNRLHEFWPVLRVQWCYRQLLRSHPAGWICLDGSRDNDAVSASSPSADGEEEIRMMTWTGGNNQTICENNLSFQDLVSAQTVFMRGWPMTAALHPASKAAYGLRMINKSVRAKLYYSMTYRSTTPNDDDVSTSSLAQDIAPRVAPIDFESTSFPRSDRTSVSFTRLEGFLKCDALTKIPDPDLQATITCRPVTAC
ncbi:MAG: hypothetical protein LQ344_004717 [Seirophora lacunosa]|nr:MAG: hypothetical protein LQ344_004717 [Seirophora lacunosa]